MDTIEQAVRERAYELWDHAGRPHGRSDEFSFAAKAQVEHKVQTESRELRAFVRSRREPPRHESAADWRLRQCASLL
jgi:Protein of unknown function (DUF2934)